MLLAATASTAFAQSAAYAQCGGKGFTGSTSCASGYKCQFSSAYYSQCVPSSSGKVQREHCSFNHAINQKTGSKPTTAAASTPTVKASSAGSSSSSSGTGKTYKASFTEYGSTDSWGSGNCNVATTACGFYTSPGYSAAVSQNEFGVGPVRMDASSNLHSRD